MQERGFFGALFDLSFSEFIVTRLIKILFILAILFSFLMAFFMLIAGIVSLVKGEVGGVVAILFTPFFLAFNIIMARIWCEMIMVIFRIEEHTGRLVQQGERGEGIGE